MRVLITSGIFVRVVAVYADLRVDDIIEVIYLDIDQTQGTPSSHLIG